MKPNSADKLTLKALSKPQDKAAKEKAVQSLRDENHLRAFNEAFRHYSHQTPTQVPLNDLHKLVQAGLFLSGEFLISKHGKDVETLSLDECLSIATTPKCLNLWIGKGEREKEKTDFLIQRFRENPAEAANSVLARWFFEFAPLEIMPDGILVFGVDGVDHFHTPAHELLKIVIERDKHSKFLASLLTLGATNPMTMETIQRAYENDTAFVELLTKRLPPAIQSGSEQAVGAILTGIFAEVPLTQDGRRKRWLSAQLLQLSGLLMAQPWSVENDRTLSELDVISQKIMKTLPSGSIDRDICIISHLGVVKKDASAHITAFGAQLVASALDGVRRGEAAAMTIEVAAFNLGMRQIAEVGDSVAFEPNLHCDTIGGAVKGDKVIVQTTGWQLGGQVIERANVTEA